MAITRYKDHDIIDNDDPDYKKAFKSRYGTRTSIKHYESDFLEYPTTEEIMQLGFTNHMWKLGDRYYKLAHSHYGDSQYWWVIALFNKKPTDQHVAIGDMVKIPLPLRDVLDIYGL